MKSLVWFLPVFDLTFPCTFVEHPDLFCLYTGCHCIAWMFIRSPLVTAGVVIVDIVLPPSEEQLLRGRCGESCSTSGLATVSTGNDFGALHGQNPSVSLITAVTSSSHPHKELSELPFLRGSVGELTAGHNRFLGDQQFRSVWYFQCRGRHNALNTLFVWSLLGLGSF